jgi:hypothetical protein
VDRGQREEGAEEGGDEGALVDELGRVAGGDHRYWVGDWRSGAFVVYLKEESRSFLKKRTKKLLDFGVRDPASVAAKEQKSFASFLQKRRPFFVRKANP